MKGKAPNKADRGESWQCGLRGYCTDVADSPVKKLGRTCHRGFPGPRGGLPWVVWQSLWPYILTTLTGNKGVWEALTNKQNNIGACFPVVMLAYCTTQKTSHGALIMSFDVLYRNPCQYDVIYRQQKVN